MTFEQETPLVTLISIGQPDRELHLTGQLAKKYDWLVAKLGPQLQKIEDELNGMIDLKAEKVHTAGWMPGSDWTNTPFQSIYSACGNDKDEAGRCFGLVVWKVFESRPERWASTHGMIDGKEIGSRTYFQWLDAI